ncbi:hypothetical protein C0583_02995 [Candidatus Parcubacteria bacterium]|nr:MAG: hypothetical protein C0583_02995 [Candidatus Parcubacteria bacterium]
MRMRVRGYDQYSRDEQKPFFRFHLGSISPDGAVKEGVSEEKVRNWIDEMTKVYAHPKAILQLEVN